MIITSLNHCKEMGAEPGRRFLKHPVGKLEPVIVAFDKERRIPAAVQFITDHVHNRPVHNRPCS